MENISIKIPAKSLYIKSIRLFAASLASDLGFNIEEVEDIRVVVSEAINYKLSDGEITINFSSEEKYLQVEVIGKDRKLDKKALAMRNLILEELCDEVTILDEKIVLTIRAK